WLWLHGVNSFHGGSTMVHLGRHTKTDRIHAASLRAALFDGGDLAIEPVPEFTEEELDWADPDQLGHTTPLVPSPGWHWHQPDRTVTARTWGGNLEILHWNLAAGRWILPNERYAGSILLLETSEEMPSGEEVFRMLRNFGERGLLEQFPAVLVAAAKATVFHTPRPPAERQGFRDEQREAVLKAFATYHPEAMITFGIDFGHTSPQWILPYGGQMTVDGPGRRIVAHY
ncbi:MAG TPA: LD-carboxypeptidase, partial [Actinoplanes sp.]|nr:LD-carboxypeptidase [Actinoplanes sp.]